MYPSRVSTSTSWPRLDPPIPNINLLASGEDKRSAQEAGGPLIVQAVTNVGQPVIYVGSDRCRNNVSRVLAITE